MKLLLVAIEDDKVISTITIMDCDQKMGPEITEKIKEEFRNYIEAENSTSTTTKCMFMFVKPGQEGKEYRIKNNRMFVTDRRSLSPLFVSINKDKSIYYDL